MSDPAWALIALTLSWIGLLIALLGQRGSFETGVLAGAFARRFPASDDDPDSVKRARVILDEFDAKCDCKEVKP